MRRLLLGLTMLSVLVAIPVSARTPNFCKHPTNGGVSVAAGANLATVAANAPAGTTFCLAAGTFTVATTIRAQDGDRWFGYGKNKTFLVGDTADMFSPEGGSSTARYTVRALDIDGPQDPPGDNDCASNCGVVFTGGQPRLVDMRCHHTGTSCVAVGSNNVMMDNVECDHNGFHLDTLRPDFQSASCVKLNRGSLTVTNSYIHDNDWVGLWCDFCDQTAFVVQDSRLIHNGARAIQWEVSGHFVAGDHALVSGNVIQDNGWRRATAEVPIGGGCAGVIISDAANIMVENNTFGGNDNCTGTGSWATRIIEGTRDPAPNENIIVRNNILNGDVACFGATTGVICSGNN